VDLDSFKSSWKKAFNGLCLVVVQSLQKEGNIKLTAQSDGLKKASIIIDVKKRNSIPAMQ
jgi:beta-galactosidase